MKQLPKAIHGYEISAMLRKSYLLLFCLTWTLNTTAETSGDNIDQELIRQAPKVMKYLKRQDYRNVGVLTFRVQKENQPPEFRGTLMNNNMAGRVENALVLAIDPENPVQVIRDARNTAGESLANASYRTPADRNRLFDVRYRLPLEVQSRYVTADAFLAGKVTVSDNLKTTTITIDAFDKRQPQKYSKLLEVEVETDRYVMTDLGYGFSTSRRGPQFARGASDSDIVQLVSEDVRRGVEPPRPQNNVPAGSFPVELTVRYDGQPQSLTRDTSAGPENWTVADPNEGQHVDFDVKNITNERLAIVLTVNGQSTLYREQGQPDQMKRWILSPGKLFRIKGFHEEDGQTYHPIVGVSESESEARFEDLGGEQMAGLIHLYVFRQQDPATLASVPSFSRGSLRYVPSQQLDLRAPRSWAELQKHVAATMSLRPSRGLMLAAADSRQETLRYDDLPNPVLTDTMIIRYYSPNRPSENP